MDSKSIKLPETLLLKDFLLSSSSSSSNGFNSFPRNQCCSTTVRFLIDIDLKQPKDSYFIFNKRKQKRPKFPISAFIAAFKRLPLSVASEKISLKKILKKGVFWKRKSSFDDIGRWKSLHQLMKESSQSCDIPTSSVMTAAISDGCNSSSELHLSYTELKRNGNEIVEVINDGEVSGDSTTSGDCGATSSSTKWAVSGEKEQLSPVSVLDCPFEDDEEVSSPFQHKGEGSTKKLMEKMKRFECLSQLEPLNLSKPFDVLVDSDNESPLPHSCASSATVSSITEEAEDEARQAEEQVFNLLQKLMDTSPLASLEIKPDKVLIDFFREKTYKHSFLEEAGQGIGEAFLGWEVQGNMERSGEWRCLGREIGEMELELEAVVFDALFEELVVDISSTTKF